MPSDIDTKSSDLVPGTLAAKDSDRYNVNVKNLLAFDSYIDFINIFVTKKNTEDIAKII